MIKHLRHLTRLFSSKSNKKQFDRKKKLDTEANSKGKLTTAKRRKLKAAQETEEWDSIVKSIEQEKQKEDREKKSTKERTDNIDPITSSQKKSATKTRREKIAERGEKIKERREACC